MGLPGKSTPRLWRFSDDDKPIKSTSSVAPRTLADATGGSVCTGTNLVKDLVAVLQPGLDPLPFQQAQGVFAVPVIHRFPEARVVLVYLAHGCIIEAGQLDDLRTHGFRLLQGV